MPWAKVTSCHPESLSRAKAAVASSRPSALHSDPVWAPVLPALL